LLPHFILFKMLGNKVRTASKTYHQFSNNKMSRNINVVRNNVLVFVNLITLYNKREIREPNKRFTPNQSETYYSKRIVIIIYSLGIPTF